MRGRGWTSGSGLALALLLTVTPHAGLAGEAVRSEARCTQAMVEGEVRAGESLRRTVVPGKLVLDVDAVPAGWIVRVEPVRGAGAMDFAELATPPYRSVNPLRITTDFGFRAQDAVGWNPRRFRFAPDAAAAAGMEAALRELGAVGAESKGAEAELARLVGRSPEGTVELLDARLIAGTGDQNKAAAVVATHFAETAHTLVGPPDGRGSPLGRLLWLRLRVRMDLPAGMATAVGVSRSLRRCTAR